MFVLVFDESLHNSDGNGTKCMVSITQTPME